MINLLRMAMDTIDGRGFIKMTTIERNGTPPNLIVDFELSSCKLDDNQRNFIKQLSEEKDFKKVLGADVEPHFKIAKILCNQLAWRILFETNRDLSYKVYIPMTQRPSEEDELALAEENV